MKINGLKIVICQMPVKPGMPDINASYMLEQIAQAVKNRADLIVFPEMCISGYLIGDLYEDNCFVRDLQHYHEQIRLASQAGITVIFGSLMFEQGAKNEDGRLRKHNAALVAQNGKWLGFTVKTLQPNYRIFDDDRHFFSTRKIWAEENEAAKEDSNPEYLGLNHFLDPFVLEASIGEISIGVILCEDMWHDDYAFNPSRDLVDKGAELIINLSVSPWSWQKNRKRHQVVSKLLADCRVPFVYVNNAGIQNTGKNIVVFDGSSTIYNELGEIIACVPAYEEGSLTFEFAEHNPPVKPVEGDDTTQLYQALKTAIRLYYKVLPPAMRKVVLGLSGGIDSAVATALYVSVLGAENVLTLNMPSKFNSQITQDIAKLIAENLGISYQVIPIQKIVDEIAQATSVEPNTLAYENIQARVRMEILAAFAQKQNCVFSANWNKVEAAFGYGTLYGDMAGFLAPLGDLVKREVYQLAEYLNHVVFQREVIPEQCFTIKPSAELSDKQQVEQDQGDPFDYGNLLKRGYHDELVRALVIFRQNPEDILELYLDNKLEQVWQLEQGTIKRLFPSVRDFIADLEKCWCLYQRAYFKRIQGPPIPIVSQRAFGTDLRESILPPYLTRRYLQLKDLVLSGRLKKKRLAIFGGSFNPPSRHHLQIAEFLKQHFDLVLIVPCGFRTDKSSANVIAAGHRKKMVELAFKRSSQIQLDLFDLDQAIYTPTFELQNRYEQQFPDYEIWHVVGGDIIFGGSANKSEIHCSWQHGLEIWQQFNFAVIFRPGYEIKIEDLPPQSELLEIPGIFGSGTMVRELIAKGEPILHLVLPEIAQYIKEHQLYM